MLNTKKSTLAPGLLGLALALVGVTSSQAAFFEGFEAPFVVGTETWEHPGVTLVSPTLVSPARDTALFPPSTEGVVGNASLWNVPFWAPVTPNANPALGLGGTRFLAVNGHTTLVPISYSKLVDILPLEAGKPFAFSALLTALFSPVLTPRADVSFQIQYYSDELGATAVGPLFATPVASPTGAVGVWNRVDLGGTIPATAGSARITIRNFEDDFSGNDTGYDNITLAVVPELSTGISAGVFALIGGLVVLRRRKAAQAA
jgi:hypothetical protein